MIDLDNTLGNRSEAVRAWIQEFCRERELSPGTAQRIFERDNDGYSARADVFAAIKERFELSDPVADLLVDYQDRVVALAAPTAGSFETLAELRSVGHTVAIVTNGSTKQQHGKIDAIGLRDLVDAVIVSGDIGIKKPDPRIFEAASDATGQPLAGAWMVGDSPLHDIVGAHALGCRTAWIRRDRSWTEPSCRPTAIIDTMAELPAAVASNG